MKTILILEDQLLIRESWKHMLEDQPKLQVIGEVADISTARAVVAEQQPDILLTDIFLIGGTALPLIVETQKLSPKTKTIVLSSSDEPAYVELLIQKGASAYLSKNCSKAELLESIEACDSGSLYLSEDIRNAMFIRKQKAVELTGREFETLVMLTRKLSNSQIAEQLNKGIKTIEAIKTSLYKKTGAYNRSELVSLAHRNALDLEDEYIIRRKVIYC